MRRHSLVPPAYTLQTASKLATASTGSVSAISLRIGPPDVIFQFAAELADGVLDGPGGAVGQAANRRAGNDADRVADLQQQIEILQPAAAGLDAIEHLQGPVRALAAGCTLAATFVGEETATVVQEIEHRDRFRPSTTTQAVPSPRQPTRIGPAKSSGVSNSASVITPVLNPPGTTAFGPAAFPHAAAELVDQLPAR